MSGITDILSNNMFQCAGVETKKRNKINTAPLKFNNIEINIELYTFGIYISRKEWERWSGYFVEEESLFYMFKNHLY